MKLCLLLLSVATAVGAAPEVVCANHVPHVPPFALQPESNAAIAKAKEGRDLGGKVHVGVRNTGTGELAIQDVVWEGRGLAEHLADHGLIWHRLQPERVGPGQEAELVLCLRQRLRERTELTIGWEGGESSVCAIEPEPPAARFEGIFFCAGRRQAWVYVSGAEGQVELFRNGMKQASRGLSRAAVDGIRVLSVDFGEPLDRGSLQVFRLRDGAGVQSVAALRAFDGLAAFGSYGGARYERFAENGLSGYACFGKVGKGALDEGAAMGIRSALTVGGSPPAATAGHPGLYAYLLMDEPDCKDYGVKDRPMGERLGAHAPQMVDYAAACHAVDPVTPTMLTVDLTFTPANYFVYGSIADIVNPDCYAVSVGWPIRVTRNYAGVMRAACAPRPFTFTYQSCWEEYAKADKPYVGAGELRAKGWDAFRDKSRKRGLGRAPSVEEVRLGMLYAVGAGAKGLFGYIDATELCGSLMFHGSEDLPEIWRAVGEMSRCLRAVAPLVEISQPVSHARAEGGKVWVQTLLAGEDAAVVVVVNEDHESTSEGFSVRPTAGLPLVFPDLPWLRGQVVGRVVPDGLQVVPSHRDKGLLWADDVRDGAVYVVTGSVRRLEVLGEQARAAAAGQTRGITQARAMRARLAQEEAQREKALFALPAERRLHGTPVNGYGFADKSFWNPEGGKYNTIDFWEKKGTKPLGVEWRAPRVAKGLYELIWQGRLYGGTVVLRVTRPDGAVVVERELGDAGGARRRNERVEFAAEDSYRISIQVGPETAREHGGRIAGVAFLVPVDR